jgi:hypothetical protein
MISELSAFEVGLFKCGKSLPRIGRQRSIMRRADLYLVMTLCGLVLFGWLIVLHPLISRTKAMEQQQEVRRLVRELGITDLCLFTEARYTRHLSQADWHAPFQDSPLSLEHFPSGSIVLPPALLEDRP